MLAGQRPDPHRLPAIASAQQRYARHPPEESLLYQIVEQHAEPFFQDLAERDVSLPGFVRKEFDAYLRCGRLEHLEEALTEGKASAVLAASVFHFGTYRIREAKKFLAERGLPVRLTRSSRN